MEMAFNFRYPMKMTGTLSLPSSQFTLPASTSNAHTNCRTKSEPILDSYPEVKTTLVRISGFSIMGGGRTIKYSTYFKFVLKNWDERKERDTAAAVMQLCFNEISLHGIQGSADIYDGASSHSQLRSHQEVYSYNWKIMYNLGWPTKCRELSENFDGYLSHTTGPHSIQRYVPRPILPQYFLNIDRDKVQFMGIQLDNVFST